MTPPEKRFTVYNNPKVMTSQKSCPLCVSGLTRGRTVTEDDLWDWENNSTIDYIQQLQRMMKS